MTSRGDSPSPGRLRRARALATCLVATLPATALLLPPSPALAQTAPQVTSQISSPEVEVGEPFTIELKALAETAEILSAPELRAPAGFSVSGPLISQQSYMQFGGGSRKIQRGIGATWTLIASTPGTFNIPAPTITWSGQKLRGSPATVKVLPQGSRPPKQQGGFLFPGGLPPGFGSVPTLPFGAEPDDDIDTPGDDPALDLPRAPFDDVFIHAIVDKTTAVVGEQVTVSVYRYYSPRADARILDTTSMALRDFLRFPLIREPEQIAKRVRVGGRSFRARLLEKYALFPLRTGKLPLGTFVDSLKTSSGRKLTRTSEDISITVTEPPIANRPVGFRQGDVGQFQISALVQPRRVEEGGSVAVAVKVTGTGNFPTALRVPEKTGLEWLDPEKKESIEPQNGEMSGFRSFGYVVRLTKTGSVDLGDIELPYWNPRSRRYEVARTVLGAVDVTPSAAATPAPSSAPSAAAEDDPWKNIPPPRPALTPYSPPPETALWLSGARFGFAVAAPPFLAIAGIGAFEGLRRLRSNLQRRKTSHRTLAASALEEARTKKAAKDERAAASAVERALVLAIEGATGLKARGVLKETLAIELAQKGVPEKLAVRASEALAACDKARFDPLAAADVSIEEAERLLADLQGARLS